MRGYGRQLGSEGIEQPQPQQQVPPRYVTKLSEVFGVVLGISPIPELQRLMSNSGEILSGDRDFVAGRVQRQNERLASFVPCSFAFSPSVDDESKCPCPEVVAVSRASVA